MRKILKSICTIFLAGAILAAPVGVFAKESPNMPGIPSVSAQCAVLMAADSGKVLFAKNENEKRPMASTTKIMTAMLTLEAAAKKNKKVTITDKMVRVEGSSMGLKPGYQLTLHDLAAGMLSVSGNDAANSAAYAIDGSPEKFVMRMNHRAEVLGMKNTHFETPSGLDGKKGTHYSTALDMAKLSAEAMKNSEFAKIAGAKTVKVTFLQPKKTVQYTNHNKLLRLYKDCTGIKTGFTKKAGRCLVSAAQRRGVRLIAVTLNAPNDWDDHKKMLDYGFSQMTSVTFDDSDARYTVSVVGSFQECVDVMGKKSKPIAMLASQKDQVERIVELPQFVYAPIHKGDQLGRIRYVLDGKTILESPLTAVCSIEAPKAKLNFWQKIAAFFWHIFHI